MTISRNLSILAEGANSSGVLATNSGGTNLTSFTSGGAVYATSTSALTTGTLPVASGGTGLTAPGTSGNVLTSNGTAWVSSAPAGGVTYAVKTANYTAVIGDNILADTSSGSFTITLPASPSTGGVISIVDSKGTFTRNALAINPNGNTINYDSTTLFISNTGFGFNLIYNGSDWRIA
jgi:hypothetical protein